MEYSLCTVDAECSTAKGMYCLSVGYCITYGDDLCRMIPNLCRIGDGNCDTDSSCISGLICGHNNFLDFHPLLKGWEHADMKHANACIKIGIPLKLHCYIYS